MTLLNLDEGMISRASTLYRRQAAAEAAWLSSRSGGGLRWPTLLEQRECRIREAAYLRAERRGFVPGHEVDDWLDAEQEIDRASRPLPWGRMQVCVAERE